MVNTRCHKHSPKLVQYVIISNRQGYIILGNNQFSFKVRYIEDVFYDL